VYYVQYAHARIASILRDAADRPRSAEAAHALHPSERELIRKLLAFPVEVAEAADRRAPHRIATYALSLAQAYTAFYRDCRVLGVPEEPFRLALSAAAGQVIAASLDLLGISAPETM
jgi:arginyl-tRNA synthetase